MIDLVVDLLQSFFIKYYVIKSLNLEKKMHSEFIIYDCVELAAVTVDEYN